MPSLANTKLIANNLVGLLKALSLSSGLLTTCSQTIVASLNPQVVTPASMPAAIAVGASLSIDSGVAQELVTVTAVTGSTFTAIFSQNHSGTWNISTPLYTLAQIGAVQDPTDVVTYAAVTLTTRKTERFTVGWKVNSKPVLQIESGIDTTSAAMPVVEGQIMDISDLLTGLFVTRYAINGAPGVYVDLVDTDDRAVYKVYPGGRIYRCHLCFVVPVDQYNVVPSP